MKYLAGKGRGQRSIIQKSVGGLYIAVKRRRGGAWQKSVDGENGRRV